MERLRSQLQKGTPRFLADEEADDHLATYEPDHVIQDLYNRVDTTIKNLFEKCMSVEHEYSILHKYNLNQHILKLKGDEGITELLHLSKYLKPLYLEFIEPMESDMKSKLLIKFRLVNEGELFCSDFHYRFADAKS